MKHTTQTATVKDMRSLTNAAEKHAALAALHAQHSNTARETAVLSADSAREYATRAKAAATDAQDFMSAARRCLIATMIAFIATLIIALNI